MTKNKTQSAGGVMKIINNITDKLSDELKEKLEPAASSQSQRRVFLSMPLKS